MNGTALNLISKRRRRAAFLLGEQCTDFAR